MPEPNFDIQPAERPKSSDNPKDKGASSARSISAASVQDLPPILRRRQTRTNYDSRFRTIDTTPLRPSWRPGQEPGIDPSKPNGGRSQAPMLHQQCQITVVNYSSDEMVMHEFNNEQFIEFLQKPQESWIKCSWINVTGLSWDVIQSIGKHKRLHKLAIEDLIGGKGLTKTEWYLDHAYMAMTLLKLVSLKEEIDDPDDSDEEKNTWTPFDPSNGFIAGHTSGETQPPAITIRKGQTSPWTRMTRKLFPKRAKQEREKDLIFEYGQSLRRYLGGVNNEWTTYMEEHSPLTSKRLAVAAEQVSIFLTADNTVISFFPLSGSEIEAPIINRLSMADTILRRGANASVLAQAIINTVIDLALPIVTAYKDVVGSLELDILTKPDIKHTSELYITTTEIEMIRSSVSPILNIVKSLRDKKNDKVDTPPSTSPGGAPHVRDDDDNSESKVKISAVALTYLRDAEDHIILITESLDSMRKSCTNMIDLIFNTISAYQNESIKQLTFVTIVFLPLGFLTAYFTVPFTDFADEKHSQKFYWGITIPVVVVVVLFLARNILTWYYRRMVQRRFLVRSRKANARSE